jgi:hypothetical protein
MLWNREMAKVPLRNEGGVPMLTAQTTSPIDPVGRSEQEAVKHTRKRGPPPM